MFITLLFSWTKNSITTRCLKWESATDGHFKNSLQLRNLPEWLETWYAWEKRQISSLQKCTFLSLLMAEKNNVGQTFLNNLRTYQFSSCFCSQLQYWIKVLKYRLTEPPSQLWPTFCYLAETWIKLPTVSPRDIAAAYIAMVYLPYKEVSFFTSECDSADLAAFLLQTMFIHVVSACTCPGFFSDFWTSCFLLIHLMCLTVM
jgi:hypothetical protein